jgi:hypothetical protein
VVVRSYLFLSILEENGLTTATSMSACATLRIADPACLGANRKEQSFSKLFTSFPHQFWQSISRDIGSTLSPCELRADREYDTILTEGPLFRAVGPAGNVLLIALAAYRAGYTQWVLRLDGDVFLMND